MLVIKSIAPNQNIFLVLSIDGKEFFFTRRLRGFDEDFFSAKWDGKDWVKAAPLGGNVNTDQNEGAQMISQDGEWLVFTACNRKDGWGSCRYLYFFSYTKRME